MTSCPTCKVHKKWFFLNIILSVISLILYDFLFWNYIFIIIFIIIAVITVASWFVLAVDWEGHHFKPLPGPFDGFQ